MLSSARGEAIFFTRRWNWISWKKTSRAAREAGADGVVFGRLTPEGELDMPAMKRLMKASEGMSVTFHRAFDYVKDPKQTLEQLIDLGVNRILTSGQQPTALQGAGLLAELVKTGRRQNHHHARDAVSMSRTSPNLPNARKPPNFISRHAKTKKAS